MTRAELAERAQALRAEGKLQREIAVILGVSRSYAGALSSNDPLGEQQRQRRTRYQGVCIDCGGPTDGSNGFAAAPERCELCYRITTKVWTREAVIEAIQRFAVEHDRPPYSSDWNHRGRGQGYPSAGCVYYSTGNRSAPFATWADAIEAAGFPRPRTGLYTRTAEVRARMSEGQRRRYARERRAA